MAKVKISEFSSTPGNNTDIDGINLAEGCAPSGINDAIRELMAQLKDFQTGAVGDSFNGPVGTTTAAAGAFTTLSASSTATLNTLASSGATLTGGTINGMAIGGTTAAAVSATTLTTSSTVTLSGGTANSVAYLNGSKVLTTGSALTFDGTNFATTGTASATKLIPTGGTATGNGMYLPATNVLGWSTNGTKQMELDSSGNLGLGVTPSAWFSTRRVLQLQTASSIASFIGSEGFEVRSNAFLNTSAQEIYVTNAPATLYGMSGGQHRFYTAPSGTAGNAISFTQAMTLDASGNLLVGTTSSSIAGGNTGVVVFSSGRTAIQRNVDGSDSVFQAFGNAGAFYIQGNGNALNTNNSYGSLSDAKLKENVVDATPKLEKLNQVRVVNYNLIGDTQKQIGVIAQELEQIFPGMVDETPDRDSEGHDLGTTTKSVKYSVFLPMLIKAIQEQQAIITALTARVAALEAA